MEILGLIDLPGWLVWFIAFITSICVYTWYKQNFFQRLGIPVKPPVFLLGDIVDISKKGYGYIDYSLYEKYGKLFGTYTGNVPTLVVSDPEMLKHITVKEFSNFTNRAETIPIKTRWSNSLTVARDEDWRYLRHAISPSFTSGKMRNLDPHIQRCAVTFMELLDEQRIEHPEGFELDSYISAYAMDIICSTGFGLDTRCQRDPGNEFLLNAKEFLDAFTGANPILFVSLLFPDIASLFPNYMGMDFVPIKNFDFYHAAVRQVLAERKKTETKHQDILQMLLRATDENDKQQADDQDGQHAHMTEEDMLVNAVFFILTGWDTTFSSVAWLIYDLATNPDVQEKLIESIDSEIGDAAPTYDNVFTMKYIDMVVSETLRMHPPAIRINREATKDMVINGVQIPKGTDCTYTSHILHFLPDYWEEPFKYNPERFAPENRHKINEYAYMPFGTGPRHCVGMRLAQLGVKMTLVSLLQKFRIHPMDALVVPMPSIKPGVDKPAKPIAVRLEKRK